MVEKSLGEKIGAAMQETTQPRRKEDLQTLVNRALGNAGDSGYDAVESPALEVAEELPEHDADLEGYLPEELEDCVRIWQLAEIARRSQRKEEPLW